jgi:hypothetical protein
MKHRRVVTTPEADADAERIDEWWIQHRGDPDADPPAQRRRADVRPILLMDKGKLAAASGASSSPR